MVKRTCTRCGGEFMTDILTARFCGPCREIRKKERNKQASELNKRASLIDVLEKYGYTVKET